MEGREAGCPGKMACGPAAALRAVGSWASGPSGVRAMPWDRPKCRDGSQKWALGDGLVEGGVLRETGSSSRPHCGHLLLLPLHSFTTGPRTLIFGPCPVALLEAGPGKCFFVPVSCLPAELSIVPGMEEVINICKVKARVWLN